jgi:cytochrome c553
MLLLACGGAPEPVATPEEVAPVADEEEVEEHMGVHFERATEARDALVFADLEAMREPFTWLSLHQPPPRLPGVGLPHFDAMRAAAAEGVEAQDIEAAAKAAAELAKACGGCHAAVEGGPTFDSSTLPPLEEGVKSHMARHRWAADRMWEGLVVPSDSAWERAIVMLGEGGVGEHEMPEAMRRSPRALELRKQVHALAGEDAPTAGHRAELYATLLVACAECHTVTGTPRPTPGP